MTKKLVADTQPPLNWICYDCGMRYGTREYGDGQLSTWHTGRCDICGKTCPVTEPRDFGAITIPPIHPLTD